jgi:hypothetical protein
MEVGERITEENKKKRRGFDGLDYTKGNDTIRIATQNRRTR